MTRIIGARARLWHVGRVTTSGPPGGSPHGAPKPLSPTTVSVDVRGLVPPLPMLRVLELLDRLGAEQRLVVIHDRRPIFLYPQLEHQGFRHTTEELGPGEFRITIWREGGTA